MRCRNADAKKTVVEIVAVVHALNAAAGGSQESTTVEGIVVTSLDPAYFAEGVMATPYSLFSPGTGENDPTLDLRAFFSPIVGEKWPRCLNSIAPTPTRQPRCGHILTYADEMGTEAGCGQCSLAH